MEFFIKISSKIKTKYFNNILSFDYIIDEFLMNRNMINKLKENIWNMYMK